MNKLLFLLIVLITACYPQTQDVSAWVSWSHDRGFIDSSLIEFKLYNSSDSVTTNFQFYKQTPDTVFYLLGDQTLYKGIDWWWYVTAIRTDTNTESIRSSKVQGKFPILIPDIPYNFNTLNINKLKE